MLQGKHFLYKSQLNNYETKNENKQTEGLLTIRTKDVIFNINKYTKEQYQKAKNINAELNYIMNRRRLLTII